MATKATGWLATHTASIVSQTDTTATIRVTAIWKNSGWRYDINYVNAWVYCNGVSKQVATNGSVSTTSDYDSETLGYYDFVVDKGTAAKSISCYAKITSNSSYVSGTKQSTATSVSVAAKPSYTITYNANGGTGAPANQTKWYGTNLTLSSTKPTKAGHSFVRWNTNTSNTGTAYNPGATYSSNAAVTLYAIWKANTYTVTYNANGGTGAPANQTKTYGVNLALSSTKPTKTNYNFLGWSTSANGGVVYKAGATYSNNSAITLYAVWELAYVKPRINNFSAQRCDSTGAVNEDGKYVKASFDWSTDKTVTSIKIEWKTQSADTWTSAAVTASGTSGTVNQVVGSGTLDNETSYIFRACVDDSGADDSITYSSQITVGTAKYPIDVKKNGTGVSFGKAAEIDGVADFAYKVKLGGGLTPIFLEAETDLDNIQTPNFYTGENISSNQYLNCPLTGGTFYLEVVSCGENGQVRQTITSCDKNDLITYVRFYYTSSWGDWINYSLGFKQIATVIGNGDTTLSTTNATPLSMKGSVVIGNLLSNNSSGQIVIGDGVKYVKIEASIYAYNGFTNGDLVHLNILKNDSTVYTATKRIAGLYETIAGSGKIISVAEGDIIKLYGRNQTAARGMISGSGNATYMTVEVVG